MASVRLVFVAVTLVGAAAWAPACFDQLGPDPQFPSDAGPDTSTGPADGGGLDGAALDSGGDTSVTGPSALLSVTSLDFGPVGCGTAGSSKSITIENNGTEPLTFSPTLDNTGAFSLSPSTGGTINPGGTSTLMVTALTVPATATAGAIIRGAVSIDSNDPAHPTQPVSLSVTPQGGTIAITPATIDFGQVPVGHSVTLPVMVTNTGNAQVAVSFTTPSDGEFSLWSSATLSQSLAAGQSVSNASVTFTPSQSAGTVSTSSAPLTVIGSTCGISPNGIGLTGTSAAGTTEVAPTALSFSTPCMGTAPAQTVTITNVGSAPLTISNVQTTGGYVAGAPSQSTIPSNEEATIAVTPAAWATGTPPGVGGSGQLTFTTSDASLPSVAIALSQTIVGASLAFTDDSDDTLSTITFPGVPIGNAQTYAFRITNSGNADVTITPENVPSPPWSWAIGGAQTVAAGGFSPLSLTFSPTTSGTSMTTVNVTSSGAVCLPPTPVTASGTGTGGEQDAGGPGDGGMTVEAGRPDAMGI